jgi:hypothetical protein
MTEIIESRLLRGLRANKPASSFALDEISDRSRAPLMRGPESRYPNATLIPPISVQRYATLVGGQGQRDFSIGDIAKTFTISTKTAWLLS